MAVPFKLGSFYRAHDECHSDFLQLDMLVVDRESQGNEEGPCR